MKNVREELLLLQRKAIGDILDVAEIGFEPRQFRKFKKRVFAIYHDWLKPEMTKVLRGAEDKSNGYERDKGI